MVWTGLDRVLPCFVLNHFPGFHVGTNATITAMTRTRTAMTMRRRSHATT